MIVLPVLARSWDGAHVQWCSAQCSPYLYVAQLCCRQKGDDIVPSILKSVFVFMYPCPEEQHACLMRFSLLPGEIHSAEGTSNNLFFLKNERIGCSCKQKWFGPRRKAGQEEWRLRIGIVLVTEPLNLVPPDKELLWWSMMQPKAKYKPFGIYNLSLFLINKEQLLGYWEESLLVQHILIFHRKLLQISVFS